jgi:hypothetical protein
MAKPLWTIEDLSAYLSVPVATIYMWRSTGEAPTAHKIGRYEMVCPLTCSTGWKRDAV